MTVPSFCNQKKVIKVDLCKIGYAVWISISALLLLSIISVGSVQATLHQETKTKISNYTHSSGTNWSESTYDSQTWQEVCYKGILDSNTQCEHIFFDEMDSAWKDLVLLGFANIFNFICWFIVLNDKYGKYEFRFLSCGDAR